MRTERNERLLCWRGLGAPGLSSILKDKREKNEMEEILSGGPEMATKSGRVTASPRTLKGIQTPPIRHWDRIWTTWKTFPPCSKRTRDPAGMPSTSIHLPNLVPIPSLPFLSNTTGEDPPPLRSVLLRQDRSTRNISIVVLARCPRVPSDQNRALVDHPSPRRGRRFRGRAY